MSGLKFDAGKPALDLIPPELLEEVGKVLGFGAKKYDKGNWAKGINYSRLIAACMRHLNEYNKGIDNDSESGFNHISHAATNLAFLLWMIQHRPDLDDRWIKSVPRSEYPDNIEES